MFEAAKIKGGDLAIKGKNRKVTVAVVGCGRKGLPVACLLAEAGFKVICIDFDHYVIERVRRGLIPFDEPSLKEVLARNIKSKRISVTSNFEEAVSTSQVIFLTVPATIDEQGRPDFTFIERACRYIGLSLRPGTLIIVGSSLSPGTTESLLKETLETASGLKAGEDFGLAYSPVYPLQGRPIWEVVNQPHVLAAINDPSYEAAKEILSTFLKGEIIKVRNIRTAEATLLLRSIYMDVNKALSNEISELCERMGIDFMEVMKSVNAQGQYNVLPPGMACDVYSRDPYLLISEAESLRIKLRIVSTSRRVNEGLNSRVFRLLRDALRSCGKTVRRARVLVLGISGMPNLKSLESSPIPELISMMQEKGVYVRVFDPLFSYKEIKKLGYETERSITQAAKDMDCLLLAVGHDRFRRLNLKRLKIVMRKPAAVVDLSHLLNCTEVENEGFIYRGLGRGVWSK
ncbi:nucleotide sugar dehydrogenase [Candidatus Bathyarchaeota archaeon]|nr:MAG: nucleotide sugar dehydrogenase [Candidatus Bathyarchaeota archaeon]